MDLEISKETKSKSRMFQYLAAVTCTFGIISSEMHYGWTSPTLPLLLNPNTTTPFKLTSAEASWLAIMPLIGAVFGATLTSCLVDVFGRKRVILLSSLPFLLSWLLVALARRPALVFVARLLAGATDGLSFTAVPMFLGEIAEPRVRGALASACPVAIVVGLLLINALGSRLDIPTTAYAATAAPAALLLTFHWMPESPYFYAMKGRPLDAERSLRAYRGAADVQPELKRLVAAVRAQTGARTSLGGRLAALFGDACNRKALFIALGLRTVQQLSGTTAITFYCKTIFAESDFMAARDAVIVFFSVQLVMSLLATVFVDIWGRRPLLIASILGTACSLFANGAFLYVKNVANASVEDLTWVPLVALLSFNVFYSVGLATIPLLIMAELFPTNVKALALCMADVYFSVIASLISKFFHATNDDFGMHVPFFAFAICSCFGLVFIWFFIPETKGHTLEDIQRYLKNEIKM